MAKQTIGASDQGIAIAERARLNKGWTYEVLARQTVPPHKKDPDPVSTKTIQKFFAGTPLSPQYFQSICTSLELDWQEIAGIKPLETNGLPQADHQHPADSTSAQPTNPVPTNISIETNILVNDGGTVIPYVQGDVTIGGS